MKYSLLYITLSLLLTPCGRSDASDANIQRELAGTWVVDMGQSVRSTNVIHPDGRFEGQVSGIPNGSNISAEGMVLVTNGVMIETFTKVSPTNVTVPFVLHGEIIRMDDHELVVHWDNMPSGTVVTSRKAER